MMSHDEQNVDNVGRRLIVQQSYNEVTSLM